VENELKDMLGLILNKLDRLESKMVGLESRMVGLESRMDKLESRQDEIYLVVTAIEQIIKCTGQRLIISSTR